MLFVVFNSFPVVQEKKSPVIFIITENSGWTKGKMWRVMSVDWLLFWPPLFSEKITIQEDQMWMLLLKELNMYYHGYKNCGHKCDSCNKFKIGRDGTCNMKNVIYLVYSKKTFFRRILGSIWAIWVGLNGDLNPAPPDSIQMLQLTEPSGHDFNSHSEPTSSQLQQSYSDFIFCLAFRFHFNFCLRHLSHLF